MQYYICLLRAAAAVVTGTAAAEALEDIYLQ
jgi:hypothetical protein